MNNNQYNPNFNYSTQIGGTALKFNLTNVLYLVAGLFILIASIIVASEGGEGLALPILYSLSLLALGVLKALGTIKMGAPIAYATAFLFYIISFFDGLEGKEVIPLLVELVLLVVMLWVGLYYLAMTIKNAALINLRANWQIGFYGGLAVAAITFILLIYDIIDKDIFKADFEWILVLILPTLANVALGIALAYDDQELAGQLATVQPVVRAPQYVQPQYQQPVDPQYAQPQYQQPTQPARPQYGQPVPPAAPQYQQPVDPQYAQPAAPQENYPNYPGQQ